ncbi:helix-turn-helix transcriptional regulator [Shinella zoogloeoides]|uniref:helix-turn-helix transcriptional regulator n=1 Tax=Shinella zoogloeoides TaxID=352475 RepID=UPI000E651268|nr:helix-turn-helix transcriptional regulator [Shinella zoogloeoides]
MPESPAANWVAPFAHALDRYDQPDGAPALLAAIGAVAPFQLALSVVHRREGGPSYVFDTFSGPRAKRAVQFFIAGTYLLNPFYNAYLAGLPAGVYLMRDLAPDNYLDSGLYHGLEIRRHEDEELGYRTHGWPEGMEELLIAMDLPGGDMAEISLSRIRSEGGFDEASVARLREAHPLITAVFRRLWAHLGRSGNHQQPRAIDHLFSDFGHGLLSPREREVALLILKGHSSESISYHLGISIATVKTHRQKLYAKLNLSTQQELFSAFLRSLNL